MPNNYFRFKQFTVYQDRCAMKVCTDACLFGGWASERIQNSKNKIQKALDIGCGTGLLSLMLAQQLPDILIDAVEIDEAASQQAKENIEASPWRREIEIYNASIQQFAAAAKHQYDIIISNPPFYENDLKSSDAKKNLALHSAELRLEELIKISDDLLKDDGKLFILIPYNRTEQLSQLIRDRFSIEEIVFVKQTPKHQFFRSMFLLGKEERSVVTSEMVVMGYDGRYSDGFVGLMREYYLNLR